MSDVLEPAVVLLGSRFDFSCDYVASHLRTRGVPYLRLNAEDLPQLALSWNPAQRHLRGSGPDLSFRVRPEVLTGILFRRPTFQRATPNGSDSPQAYLARLHWEAFLRNFMMYASCQWVNHPAATYEAEHKALQLAVASDIGLDIPRTRITNSASAVSEVSSSGRVALKGLDTVLWRENGQDHFGYTNLISSDELAESDLSDMPATIQEAISNKLDLRVTVVGTDVWTASVSTEGSGIDGDWRLLKEEADFEVFTLPREIEQRCVDLTKKLGLTFGAIDLALINGTYVFFEINPTGEWAWLEERLSFPVAETLAAHLAPHTNSEGG